MPNPSCALSTSSAVTLQSSNSIRQCRASHILVHSSTFSSCPTYTPHPVRASPPAEAASGDLSPADAQHNINNGTDTHSTGANATAARLSTHNAPASSPTAPCVMSAGEALRGKARESGTDREGSSGGARRPLLSQQQTGAHAAPAAPADNTRPADTTTHKVGSHLDTGFAQSPVKGMP